MVNLPHDIEGLAVAHSYGWYYLLAVLWLVALAVVWFLWWRKLKGQQAVPAPVNFFEDLRKRLEALAVASPSASEAKAYATMLSDAARQLAEHCGVPDATGMTTEELTKKLNATRSVFGEADDKTKFCQILRQMDRIKYAGFTFDPAEYRRGVEDLKSLVTSCSNTGAVEHVP